MAKSLKDQLKEAHDELEEALLKQGKAEGRITELEPQLEALTTRLQGAGDRIDELEGKVSELEDLVATKDARITELETQVEAAAEDANVAESTIAELRADLDVASDQIDDLVSDVYVRWRESASVPGGHVSANAFSKNPPIEALQAAAHQLCTFEDYEQGRKFDFWG